jgi:hypothetical protein
MDRFLLLLPSLLISLVGLGLAIDARRYSRRRDSSEDLRKRIDECVREAVASIVARVITMETKVEIFWKGVSFSASQALHSPHRKDDLDPLIEKFQCDQIDDAELVEFKRMLREIVEDEAQTAFHRKNARDVLTLIKIRYEIASDVAAV